MSKTKSKKLHDGNGLHGDFLVATIPPLIMGTFFYGLRVLLLALLAVVTALITDRVTSMLRSNRYDETENSSIVIGLIIVLMMPASVPIHLVIVAVAAGTLVGKHAFGGYLNYPFNPAAVGFCIAAVSWREDMFRYPVPQNWLFNNKLNFQQMWDIWAFKDVPLVEGASNLLRNRGVPNIPFWNMILGEVAGPLGATATLVLVACGVYLYTKKRIDWVPACVFVLTVAVFAFLFPRAPEGAWKAWALQDLILRLRVTAYEIVSGATIFAAVFLVNEPATLPKTKHSQIVYAVLLGVATVVFRYFGTFDVGICFAFLLVNAVSGYFDRLVNRYWPDKVKGVKAA